MTTTVKIYGDSRSGNCYKQQLVCAELSIDYDWQEIDIMSGESRTDAFLAKNPNGRVPLLELPDGRCLSESNAILWYLATGSPLVHDDRYAAGNILRWMFFEQYSHEPYIAVSRFIMKYLGNPPDRQEDLIMKRSGGYQALDVMEKELGSHDFIANDRFSVADIALYAYTHVADEGGFDLGNYPNINQWLARIAARKKYVPMGGAA